MYDIHLHLNVISSHGFGIWVHKELGVDWSRRGLGQVFGTRGRTQESRAGVMEHGK